MAKRCGRWFFRRQEALDGLAQVQDTGGVESSRYLYLEPARSQVYLASGFVFYCLVISLLGLFPGLCSDVSNDSL